MSLRAALNWQQKAFLLELIALRYERSFFGPPAASHAAVRVTVLISLGADGLSKQKPVLVCRGFEKPWHCAASYVRRAAGERLLCEGEVGRPRPPETRYTCRLTVRDPSTTATVSPARGQERHQYVPICRVHGAMDCKYERRGGFPGTMSEKGVPREKLKSVSYLSHSSRESGYVTRNRYQSG